MVPDKEWQFGEHSWGRTVYNEDGVPERVYIRYGGRVPLSRSRFTEAHEVAHLAFGDRPASSELKKTLHRGKVKELRQKGVETPIRWQEVVGNERADLFAEATLVDEDCLRLDLGRGNYTLTQLRGEYGVSGWVMACSIVRVCPQPCIALAFSPEKPLGVIRANDAAIRKSGLYEWALRELWQRRHTGEWVTASQALRDQYEVGERLTLGAFVLGVSYMPAGQDKWFFRYRNDKAELIALFMEDLDKSTAHRVPDTPLLFQANGGELQCFLGPSSADKSRLWMRTLEAEVHRHGDDKVKAFRFFGTYNDEDAYLVEPLWDRSGVSVLERLDPEAQVIAFDEAHFARIEFMHVVRLLLSLGKKVIIAALDLDFRGTPWPIIGELLPFAQAFSRENITYCRTGCRWPLGCNDEARFSQLVGIYPDDVYHIITNRDTFHPVCSKHFRPHAIQKSDWGHMQAQVTRPNDSRQLCLDL